MTSESGNSRSENGRGGLDPFAAEGEIPEEDFEDPFDEDDPLVRRLSNLSWPPAPPEVKERVFQRLLKQMEEMGEQRPPAEGGSGEAGSAQD